MVVATYTGHFSVFQMHLVFKFQQRSKQVVLFCHWVATPNHVDSWCDLRWLATCLDVGNSIGHSPALRSSGSKPSRTLYQLSASEFLDVVTYNIKNWKFATFKSAELGTLWLPQSKDWKRMRVLETGCPIQFKDWILNASLFERLCTVWSDYISGDSGKKSFEIRRWTHGSQDTADRPSWEDPRMQQLEPVETLEPLASHEKRQLGLCRLTCRPHDVGQHVVQKLAATSPQFQQFISEAKINIQIECDIKCVICNLNLANVKDSELRMCQHHLCGTRNAIISFPYCCTRHCTTPPFFNWEARSGPWCFKTSFYKELLNMPSQIPKLCFLFSTPVNTSWISIPFALFLMILHRGQ